MVLTINIPRDAEQRLKATAARLGINDADYAAQLIVAHLPPAELPKDQATLDLLTQWDEEDSTDDPAEIARRQQEWEEFRSAMNEDSLSGRPVYP